MSSGVLSREFEGYIGQSSMIRAMFETGIKLKKEHGEDKVCDFSLGNPDLPPPREVKQAMLELAEEADKPFAFGYMPNAGFPWLLEMMADEYSREQGTKISAGDILLTGGAAGAINCLFRAVLERGDEVIGMRPYFVDYINYAANFGGVFKPVDTSADFSLNLAAIEAAITAQTRVVLINSPHNPTGQIYSKEELEGLVAILRKKSAEHGRPIFLASDEPYRFLTFDGAVVPAVLPMYEYAIVLGSFAKNMSLPGERLGYLIASPNMPDKASFMGGVVMASRILGFLNAPVVGQKILKHALGKGVDLEIYARRRQMLGQILSDAGYEFTMPRGAFYFFPKAPGGDDLAFNQILAKQLILGVPGTGFGMPGYFRLAFCVDEKVIARSADGFKRAIDSVK
ncbi:pyridoxal phosphate-dependent aminotransferase [Desulfovibrio sp. OttesenSCG-928-C06]|nr:pyridoxal phosphate-dependent aminotransferase [Desulfovibrio sp. OttesenSCG-928-C06]